MEEMLDFFISQPQHNTNAKAMQWNDIPKLV